ncbi:MAG: hypothetical protein A2231_01675 [Candidatus Firestonebacteria bacterium RIFOXYA2_FULL_40_8]|nr:MAG: hypothetical protein A2231_01675 [Candidatus Firestonebacteria bacterium RIFOXYA2_FULL_40_8]
MNKKAIIISIVLLQSICFCADWPMWRGDASRSASTSEELPKDLQLQWVYELHPNAMAWIDQPRMTFGNVYEPIVAGKTMYIGSSVSDKVTAVDTETCEEKWVFYTEGPVYFAPVFWQEKVYFGSDDGYMYCLDAEKGNLLWKFKGAPSDKRIIGNERLISAWPVRGAPVLLDGKIYFSAGIWPFMGVFIYALDANTGKVIWSNSKSGSMFMLQPHDSPAFSGVAPQGYLAAVGDKLLVPNGRSVPAVFNRLTGELLYFKHAESKQNGEYQVAASKKYFFNSKITYNLETGKTDYWVGFNNGLVLTKNAVFANVGDDSNQIRAYNSDDISEMFWKLQSDDAMVQLQAGSKLYALGKNFVKAIEIPELKKTKDVLSAKTVWKADIKGTPAQVIAADKKLFVSTKEGSIYCFSGKNEKTKTIAFKKKEAAPKDAWSDYTGKIIVTTGVKEGFCLVLGTGTGRLIEELVNKTKLNIIAVEPDGKKAEQVRKNLDALGIYGERAVVLQESFEPLELPPYMAELVVSEEPYFGINNQENIKKLYNILRPYGGTVCLPEKKEKQDALVSEIKKSALVSVEIKNNESFVLFSKTGSLPNSAAWTHQYADASNSCVSKDDLVKAPLGLLWFGGSSSKSILPRHGHGPSEQVVGGRLFIQGPDMLRAVDVYTGRVLWEKSLPDVGAFYNETSHQAGANGVGSNYVSVADGIYVLYGNKCLRLDPATGKQLSEFILTDRNLKPGDSCGYIGIWKDLLIVTNFTLLNKAETEDAKINPAIVKTWRNVFSTQIMCLNRNSGKVLWKYNAKSGFRHNSIAMGGDRIYCIDNLSSVVVSMIKQKGQTISDAKKLIALDLATGKVDWSVSSKDLFGTWLGYSEEHDILLQAGRSSSDALPDEPRNQLSAYSGKTGKQLWSKKGEFSGPCMLNGDTIYTGNGGAYSLLNGEVKKYKNPITGTDIEWKLTRNYGCNSLIASKNLITFRSAAAGFYDLETNSGTANLGGFKSGCTSNLIAADGVLNAPDYTYTCECSYQNQSSLGLIYMPENEMWTFNELFLSSNNQVKRLGINFGAPGDRQDKEGTLWLDYPSVGGPSPEPKMKVVPAAPEYFSNHSSMIKEGKLKWVSASGAKGVESVTLTINKNAVEAVPYTVRLYFADPENKKEGERVFDVSIQGVKLIDKFDIIKEAKGPDCEVIKTFDKILVKDTLIVEFSPAKDSLLCGLEVISNSKK